MSRSNEATLSLAIALLTGAMAPAAQAALEVPSQEVADLRTAQLGAGNRVSNDPAAGRGARVASRNVLRCWQFGRLIYEGQGVVRGSADKGAGPSLQAPGGGSVHLYDMNTATCILEQAGG